MMSQPEHPISEDDLTKVLDLFLQRLKAREGGREQCSAMSPDGVRCQKAVQADGAPHEERHIAWVAGISREWWTDWPGPPPTFVRPGGGFTGEACAVCGSLAVIKDGTCGTCQDCGSSTGCG